MQLVLGVFSVIPILQFLAHVLYEWFRIHCETLEARGVTHVFGIPGAKVDSLFIALLDSSIELVLCRHEQNAAFMAQALDV